MGTSRLQTAIPQSRKTDDTPNKQTNNVGQNNQEYRLEYWATRSSIHSHRSLVCLLRPTRFACALRCAHSLARSLTLLTPLLVGQWMILCFLLFWTIAKGWKWGNDVRVLIAKKRTYEGAKGKKALAYPMATVVSAVFKTLWLGRRTIMTFCALKRPISWF